MPRIQHLVLLATLKRHYAEGLVVAVEILNDGQGWTVCVHYDEKAHGQKTRFLTSYRKAGARRFASLSRVWKILDGNGIEQVVVRKASPEEATHLSEL